MAENEWPDVDPGETVQTKRGFASAFVNRVAGKESGRRFGPRIWAVGLAVVLVAGIAVAIGFLAKPHPPAPKAAPAARTVPQSATSTLPTSVPRTSFPPAGALVPNVGSGGGGGSVGLPAGGGGGGGGVGGGNLPQAGANNQPVAAPAPAPAPKPVPPAPKPMPPATFSAITGYGCAESASLVFTQYGFYSDGKKGWIRLHSGGLKANGCDGDFDAMPMSGSANSDDNSNSATWQFRTGAVRSGTCKVSVWIPNDTNPVDVGGHPSDYLVYNSFTPTGTAQYGFQVQQAGNAGRWAMSPPLRITGGAISVRLLSRGIDYNHAGNADYAHHAVSAVMIQCTA